LPMVIEKATGSNPIFCTRMVANQQPFLYSF
jgi:hypothetical protein